MMQAITSKFTPVNARLIFDESYAQNNNNNNGLINKLKIIRN